MTEKLSAEQRRKVALAVFPDYSLPALQGLASHKYALAQKTAQLIEALPGGEWHTADRKIIYWLELGKALATNNTEAIEALLYELLENNHG